MTLLSIKDLDVFYGKAQALHGVSLDVSAGTIVAIIGPNGAGKSTLLDSIVGLTKRQGQITFDGRDITRMAAAKIVRLGIGYAPERGHLFPFMGVKENLLVGAYNKRDEIESNLRKVFDLFPGLEQRQKQESATQSGGERQMLSLGRALMSSPKLLIVDEPTIGLAPRVCQSTWWTGRISAASSRRPSSTATPSSSESRPAAPLRCWRGACAPPSRRVCRRAWAGSRASPRVSVAL